MPDHFKVKILPDHAALRSISCKLDFTVLYFASWTSTEQPETKLQECELLLHDRLLSAWRPSLVAMRHSLASTMSNIQAIGHFGNEPEYVICPTSRQQGALPTGSACCARGYGHVACHLTCNATKLTRTFPYHGSVIQIQAQRLPDAAGKRAFFSVFGNNFNSDCMSYNLIGEGAYWRGLLVSEGMEE